MEELLPDWFWAKSRSAFGQKYECHNTSCLTLLSILPGPRRPEFAYFTSVIRKLFLIEKNN
jgi:hypothetical protein